MSEYKSEAELKAKTEPFIEKLGLESVTANVKNKGDYMLCLVIRHKDKAEGNVKIYHKASKGTFSINVAEVRNPDVRTIIESAWNDCNGIKLAPKSEENQEVKYYYDILKKYRENRVDLVAFAIVLNRELRKKGKKEIGVDPEKCDFALLEKHYKELLGEG